jgi:hypothetical protein
MYVCTIMRVERVARDQISSRFTAAADLRHMPILQITHLSTT